MKFSTEQTDKSAGEVLLELLIAEGVVNPPIEENDPE